MGKVAEEIVSEVQDEVLLELPGVEGERVELTDEERDEMGIEGMASHTRKVIAVALGIHAASLLSAAKKDEQLECKVAAREKKGDAALIKESILPLLNPPAQGTLELQDKGLVAWLQIEIERNMRRYGTACAVAAKEESDNADRTAELALVSGAQTIAARFAVLLREGIERGWHDGVRSLELAPDATLDRLLNIHRSRELAQ